MPPTGGGLVMSNHQSNLDPVLIGLCCERRLNYVARQTLLTFAPLRWLFNSLDAIPIDRDGTGLGGLKETLKRLKRGELVLLFPEGTRTQGRRSAAHQAGLLCPGTPGGGAAGARGDGRRLRRLAAAAQVSRGPP